MYNTQPLPPPDNSKKFLNMSGGVLALVIAGIILLPFLLCVLCGFFGVLGAAINPTPTTTP